VRGPAGLRLYRATASEYSVLAKDGRPDQRIMVAMDPDDQARTATTWRIDMRFRTTVRQSGKTTTGIQVPDEVVEALGSGKRPAVKVTINGYTYRSTVAVLGGGYMVGVSAEHRAGAGVAGGDEVDVDIELDTAPREVTVPADFAAALDAEPAARRTFDGLSYSNKSWHVFQVDGAKTDETRQRRIAKSVAALKEGRAR
jgi:Bacteriocin-protection, YdeI or OmpD-Associated/Domain of unknown function (DUF1905)